MDPERAQTEPLPQPLLIKLLGFIKSLIGITIIVWRFSMKIGDLVYHKQSFVDEEQVYVGYVGGIVPSSCEQHYKINLA